jgi:ribonucleotide reductase beta subunit family protein with ferritin-like domain
MSTRSHSTKIKFISASVGSFGRSYLSILIRFAKLTKADGCHADNTSRSEAKQRRKYIEENYMMFNRKPECECY